MQVLQKITELPRQPNQPWSILEASRFLGVSSRHLIRQIELSKVRTIRMGRRRLIPDAEVQRVATEGL